MYFLSGLVNMKDNAAMSKEIAVWFIRLFHAFLNRIMCMICIKKYPIYLITC